MTERPVGSGNDDDDIVAIDGPEPRFSPEIAARREGDDGADEDEIVPVSEPEPESPPPEF